MADLIPVLDAAGVNALLRKAFPGAQPEALPTVLEVTSSLTMNFLRGAKPGDLHAEAEMLRLGRRIAVCDVRLWTKGPKRLAAQAVVTYAIAS